MDLHTWITQQVDAAERRARTCDATDWRHVFDGIIVDRDTDGWQSAPDNAVIARVTYERIYWNCSPANSPEADHIVTNDPDTVLRRCEADRRILARHRRDPDCLACKGCCNDDWGLPNVDNVNDCPELFDLAHAHGITPEILAGLDQPQPPERQPGHQIGTATIGIAVTPVITTSDVPAALRGPHWKP